MKKVSPEVAQASRSILLLLKKGKRNSDYLKKRVGPDAYAALSWLALNDLITTGPMDYELAIKRLQALANRPVDGKLKRFKKHKPALYFLSNRGKEVVELLGETK